LDDIGPAKEPKERMMVDEHDTRGDDILLDPTEPQLVTAIKANLYAFFESLQQSPLTEFSTDDQLIRWRTPIPHPWFNGVLSRRPAAMDEQATIQAIQAFFRTRHNTGMTWWLAPELPFANWSEQLQAQGFQYDGNTPGMALFLDQLAAPTAHPPGLVIRPVESLATLRVWVHTFLLGYGIPTAWSEPFFELLAGMGLALPFRYYLAWHDDGPVATSALFLAAGVAGIYNVATVAGARGQGIGAAVTAQPLEDARTLGYRVGILQSSDMGLRVYERLGFRQLCKMEHFYWSPA
jgi:GNAT superfamily N-acetyltransferase